MTRTDAVHLGLMVAALGLTYLVPFELLLSSHVILGPAHYATEISWLHDRKYFLPRRGIAVGLAITAIVAALIDNASWFGFVIWAAFVGCALLAAARTAFQSMMLFMAAIVLTGVIVWRISCWSSRSTVSRCASWRPQPGTGVMKAVQRA